MEEGQKGHGEDPAQMNGATDFPQIQYCVFA